MWFNNLRILAKVNNYLNPLDLLHKKLKTINSVNYKENSIIQFWTIPNMIANYMGIVYLYKWYMIIIKLNLINSKMHLILQ